MIALALLLAIQVPSAAVVEEQETIVVTANRMERLKRLRMTTKFDPKTRTTRCIYKRRSGVPALDAAVCDAVLACVPKVKTVEEMTACITPTMNRLVADDAGWEAGAAKRDRGQ